MNKINPRKLLGSKWTAVTPINKEKHFIISDLEFDEEGLVTLCNIEAIMTKRTVAIDWYDLNNDSNWIKGWK